MNEPRIKAYYRYLLRRGSSQYEISLCNFTKGNFITLKEKYSNEGIPLKRALFLIDYWNNHSLNSNIDVNEYFHQISGL